MADNVAITAGSGTTIATDDVGGVHYQQVKLVASALDSAEALSKAEDAAHSSGHHGIMALAVRQDALAPMAGTDADYIPLSTDSQGRLNVAPGATVTVSASITRPSDTTAYAAGDAVTNSTSSPSVSTFTNCARVNGGSGTILDATLIDSANVATKGSFELWLFDTTATPDNDNAAFTPTDAECETLVAILVFDVAYVGDATSGAGGNAVYPGGLKLSGPVSFVCGGSSKDLFGLLVVRNAYTPVSAEKFVVRLRILQD